MKLDRRKELDDVDVLISGTLTVPTQGRQGVGFGYMDDTYSTFTSSRTPGVLPRSHPLRHDHW